MARTIAEAFEVFQRSYAPTIVAKEIASAKQQHLRNSLSSRLNIIEDFLIGSYVKQTQIRPTTDIDIFVVLDSSYWTDQNIQTPRKLFTLLLRNLRLTYPRTAIRKDGQAIKLNFRDMFTVDLVPAFKSPDDSYIIPDQKTQSWISCNPKEHIKFLTGINNKMRMSLKPLIKMIKCWNMRHEVKIKSFHLELLVASSMLNTADIERDKIIASYPFALLNFFHYAGHSIDEPIYDEVNERVDSYLDKGNLRRIAWRKLMYALQKAHEAWYFQKRSNQVRAIASWKQLFGSYFPGVG